MQSDIENLSAILLVDDSHIVRKSHMKALQSKGLTKFIEAENGLDALNLLNTEPISAMIVDINMPKMDGLEFLKLLRAKEGGENIPVIIVSASNSRNNIIQAVKLQASFVLNKPVNPEVLFNSITQAINNNQQAVDVNWQILIADELPAARKIIRKLLNDLNLANVLEAANLLELEQFLSATTPDIVIADWSLSMNKLVDFLEVRKQSKKLTSIPFIVTASDADRDTVINAAAAGANNFLSKPFDKNLLRQMIVSAVK